MLWSSSERTPDDESLMTGAFSQDVGKLFSELKLVTDNLLFTQLPHSVAMGDLLCFRTLASFWNKESLDVMRQK